MKPSAVHRDIFHFIKERGRVTIPETRGEFFMRGYKGDITRRLRELTLECAEAFGRQVVRKDMTKNERRLNRGCEVWYEFIGTDERGQYLMKGVK